MAEWYRARQQFNADMEDGSQRTVHLGESLPAGDALVKRDLDAAAAAAKAGLEREALFEPLEAETPAAEAEAEEAPAAKPARGRAGKGGTP